MKTNCFRIGKSMVGQGKPCFFIAEVGPNHNGSLDNAKKLIFEAKKSGCNAIKFQYHIAEEEIADKSTKIPWANIKRYDFIKNVQEFTFNEHPTGINRTSTGRIFHSPDRRHNSCTVKVTMAYHEKKT